METPLNVQVIAKQVLKDQQAIRLHRPTKFSSSRFCSVPVKQWANYRG